MKKLLELALDIGEQMIFSGAEVHRVEDTLNRICTAFGASRVDVFIITTSMVLTVHDENGVSFTQTRRILSSGTDFNKLSKLNALSRKICSTKNLNEEEIRNELKEISNSKTYPLWFEFIIYSIIAMAFTLFFNGTFIQSVLSLFIGFLVRWLILFSDKYVKNKIFNKFIASFGLTAFSYIAFKLKIVLSVDEIIIGNIMVLISGVGLTNSLRDLFTGDSMAGVLRFIESLLTAVAIALGYLVFIFLIGETPYFTAIPKSAQFYKYVIEIVMAIIGSIGFGMLYNVRNKNLIAVGVGGALAWGTYLLLYSFINNETVCYFIVSVAVSLFAEVMARLLKAPTTVFLTPSLIPLVPGASLYYSMTFMFSGNLELFTGKAFATLQLAGALALGVIFSSVVMKFINTLILNKIVKK